MRKTLLIGALAVAGLVTAGCSSSPAPAAAPTPPPAAAKKGGEGVRGQITAETGSSWTVTTAKGRAFTVTVDPQTAYGSKAAPATVAQFPVGTMVRVVGTRSGSAVTATRIVLAKNAASPSGGATPTPTASAIPAA